MGNNNSVYAIGENKKGELGVGHDEEVKTLTKVKKTGIHYIESGYQYTICSNKYGDKIWSVGNDSWGQLGLDKNNHNGLNPITRFKENKINIKKICINPMGSTSFFITTEGDVWACGSNSHGQFKSKPNSMNQRRHELEKINELKEIADIQSAHYYSIALAQTNNDEAIMIINNWSKKQLQQLLPTDIINLIIIHYKISNKVRLYCHIYSV